MQNLTLATSEEGTTLISRTVLQNNHGKLIPECQNIMGFAAASGDADCSGAKWTPKAPVQSDQRQI